MFSVSHKDHKVWVQSVEMTENSDPVTEGSTSFLVKPAPRMRAMTPLLRIRIGRGSDEGGGGRKTHMNKEEHRVGSRCDAAR